MSQNTKLWILAIAALSLIGCMGLDRAGGGEAGAGQAPSISLAQAPLAAQVAVGGLVLLFMLIAVAPAFLKEREVGGR